jgi:hypothetical protein
MEKNNDKLATSASRERPRSFERFRRKSKNGRSGNAHDLVRRMSVKTGPPTEQPAMEQVPKPQRSDLKKSMGEPVIIEFTNTDGMLPLAFFR